MSDTRINYLGAIWGLVGFTIIIASAFFRLLPHVDAAFKAGLDAQQWIILISWSGLMLFAEGYRGFQKQFAPRFAARAFYLSRSPNMKYQLLAPLFCVGYVYATRRRMVSAWTLTFAVVTLIAIVRLVAQPWRGIIDTGVVLGLGYGLLTVYYFFIKAFIDNGSPVNPELCDQS